LFFDDFPSFSYFAEGPRKIGDLNSGYNWSKYMLGLVPEASNSPEECNKSCVKLSSCQNFFFRKGDNCWLAKEGTGLVADSKSNI
jgi:hypothetical protein